MPQSSNKKTWTSLKTFLGCLIGKIKEVLFYRKIWKSGDQQNEKSETTSNKLTQTKIFCDKLLKLKIT